MAAARSSTRSHAELLVLGNLTRDQLDRFGEVRAIAEQWREVCTTHPEHRRSSRTRPTRTWSGPRRRRTRPGSRSARRGAATPRPARSARRLLTWSADRFDCPTCGFAQPETPHRLDGDALVLDGERIPMHLAPARDAGTA